MKPKEMYVEKIGVGAMARGQGIGSALLAWAEEQARAPKMQHDESCCA